jgi:hypothetical protein
LLLALAALERQEVVETEVLEVKANLVLLPLWVVAMVVHTTSHTQEQTAVLAVDTHIAQETSQLVV